MVDAAHNIALFDRQNLRDKRQRIAARLDQHRFLIDWADNILADRLRDVNRQFPTALQIGSRSNKGAFLDTGKIEQLFTLDNIGTYGADIIGDEEFLPLAPASLDLVTSTLNLHSVNDLPGALLQIKRALKPDGMFLGAMLGGETLYELRDCLTEAELALKGGVSPRVAPFADKQQMGALLQRAGFSLPVVDSEIVTVTYDNIFHLMHDLRFMGESNMIAARSRSNPGKAFFMDAATRYAAKYSDPDGRIRASFEVIFLIGWSPHESQQQPLKPGSAKTRLSDILSTEEISTGEAAKP